MGKKDKIHEITALLSKSLRHKIGSIVNKEDIYASKYARDADVLMKEARKIAISENWNAYDKSKIKFELSKKLKNELQKKEFLDDKKFGLMDKEIGYALKVLELD